MPPFQCWKVPSDLCHRLRRGSPWLTLPTPVPAPLQWLHACMSSNKPCRTPLAAVREGCIPVPSTLGGFHEELPELFELRDTAINLASKRPGTGCLRWHISEAVEQHKLATTTATPYPAVPHRRPAHQPLVIRRGIAEIITHCVGVLSPCTVCHQQSIAPWRMCQVSDLPADWRHRTYMSSLDRPLLHSSYAGLYR